MTSMAISITRSHTATERLEEYRTMNRLAKLSLVAAVVIGPAACRQSDLSSPPRMDSNKRPQAYRVTVSKAAVEPKAGARAPDVAAAEARVTAALEQVLDHAPAARREQIKHALTTPGHFLSESNDANLSVLIGQYYEARIQANIERHRERSVAQAYEQLVGVSVTLALGNPEGGAEATVLRRRSVFPDIVIVLGPGATPRILAAALSAVDRSRRIDGDDLLTDQRLVISKVTGDQNPGAEARLGAMLAQLRKASPQTIEGVGHLPAIKIQTDRLRKPSA